MPIKKLINEGGQMGRGNCVEKVNRLMASRANLKSGTVAGWLLVCLMWTSGSGQVNLGGKLVNKDSIYVYICIGHSNMAGRSKYVSAYHAGTPIHPRAWNYEITDATNTTDGLNGPPLVHHSFYPAKPPVHHDQNGTHGNDYTDCGPTLAFVKGMAAAYPQFNFAVTQNAHSGAGFVRDPSSPHNPQEYYSPGGNLYNEIISAVQSLAGKVTWGGMITFIGRAAAGYAPELNNFETNMSSFIDDIRQAAQDPLLPVYSIKYEHNIGSSSQRISINADMALVAASKPPMHLIETAGCQTMQAGVNAEADNITHYSQASYDMLAVRIMDTIAAMPGEGPAKLPAITSPSNITVKPEVAFGYLVEFVNITNPVINWIRLPFGATMVTPDSISGVAPAIEDTDSIVVAVTGDEGGDTLAVIVQVVPFTGIKVNFQELSASTIEPGYVVDNGLLFGDRGNGFAYGWDKDITTHFRTRTGGADFLHNSLTGTNIKDSARTWEIELPNGDYRVRMVAGDPQYLSERKQLDLEGVNVIDGVGMQDQTVTVKLVDGKLTLTNTPGSTDSVPNANGNWGTNVVNFMEIALLVSNFRASRALPGIQPSAPLLRVATNPFRPGSAIDFSIARAGDVLVSLFSQNGQHIRTFAEGLHPAGHFRVHWAGMDAQDRPVSSGHYLLMMSCGNRLISRKVLLVR